MATTVTGKKRKTQTETLNMLADKFGMKRADVKKHFEDLAAAAIAEVQESGEFNLPGFGKLVLAERAAREGRNPSTGEPIQIAAKTTVKFKLAKSLKDALEPGK